MAKKKWTFIVSSAESRASAPQKIHVARDADYFEYSRTFCGMKNKLPWRQVTPSNEDQLMKSEGFCIGCRNALTEGFVHSWKSRRPA